MHLIVAEKNISARRIAQILAEGHKVTEKKDAGVSTYSFGDTTTVGLRGHVVEVDFEPLCKDLGDPAGRDVFFCDDQVHVRSPLHALEALNHQPVELARIGTPPCLFHGLSDKEVQGPVLSGLIVLDRF